MNAMPNRSKNDATFDAAAHMVVLMQSASVNDLRVKLKFTDAKAFKVMEKLANVGIIGPMDENGSAEVLISTFIDLESLLSA